MQDEVLKQKIISVLKSIFDPEIPVDIYELGLIYKIEISEKNKVFIEMTLTAPNCPVADNIIQEVYIKVNEIEEVHNLDVHLTFEPPWNVNMASEIAQLELGVL
ncbi:MAG: iron-sulfur cluster assembly protein [Deltaproteobacteria bacterium]